jgi:hypothetical protein
MSFASDIKRFVVKVERRNRAVYVGIANAVHASIVRGSPITGAPGQPVDTGFLLGSWKLNIGKEQATVATNVAYARVIEDNNRAAYDARGVLPDPEKKKGPRRKSIKSTVGGHHSVKTTIAGASLLQNAVLGELGDA